MDANGLASPHNTYTSFVRVISLSVAFYDYLLTLPAECRFYRSQRSWRLSLGCVLFIAIRYSSIAVLTVSNVGYFGNFFTPEACSHYFMAAPIFKVIQTMTSQMILGIRTVNISRRSKPVIWLIGTSFFLCTTAQWILNLWNRVPVQGRHSNCTAANRPPILTVWPYYLISIVYDILTLVVSSMYLISFNPNSGKMAHLRRIMLTDGLVYFVALTGVNIFNLILYRRPDEALQSSGVSLGYALTWIMSQRILIHLRDAAAAHNRSITTQIVVSRALPSAHSVAHAMRSQFESKERHRGGRHYTLSASASARRDALSSGFDVPVDDPDVDWSLASGAQRDARDVERSVLTVSVARSCECACDCAWASDAGSSADASATSGVGPVAHATLGAGRRACGKEEEGERGRSRARGRFCARGSVEDSDGEEEKEVRVQVEETVTVEVEYDPVAYERESYRAPRVLWDPPGGPSGRRGPGEKGREDGVT